MQRLYSQIPKNVMQKKAGLIETGFLYHLAFKTSQLEVKSAKSLAKCFNF